MNSSIKTIKGKYVIHFLQLLTTEKDKQDIDNGYRIAINNAKPLGGRKFHNKSFGGGIAFDYQQDAENALEWVDGQAKTVWCYVVTHSDGSVNWIGKTTVAEAKKLEGNDKMVASYLKESSYLEMKRNCEQSQA